MGEQRERETNTVPLPEHLGERGVAVIRPGGRRGARKRGGGRGGKRKGLTTLRRDRRVTGKRVRARRDWREGLRYKAVSKQAKKLSQTTKLVQ